MTKEFRNYIDGQWVEADSGKWMDVVNPATQELIGRVPDAGEAETRRAIEAAYRAFPEWASATALERANLLWRWYELIQEHAEELARLITEEMGKPLAEAKGEVAVLAADYVRWYAEEARRVYGETIPASAPNKRFLVFKQPVGVVGAITPWNFPAGMVTRKIAPALAAGCTVVIKPAEQTPITAIRLFELLEEAGFPKGVANLVTGQPEPIGQTLLRDDRVRKITFTGSTEVGKLLMRGAADTVKKVSLELGGHAPFLIFEDADLDQAVRGVMASKFRNTGQTCVCANRIYVHESVKEPFIQKLKSQMERLVIGNGMQDGVQIGPLIDRQAFEKVKRQVEDARAKGAIVHCGGEAAQVAGQKGYFFQPTLLADVTPEMQIMHEETFGPVAPVVSFSDEQEVIRQANALPYGLAAYLFTNSLSRAIRVSEQLEFGMVSVNDGVFTAAQVPFGGVKESGLGREGGRQGIEEFLETKFVALTLL
ncbi:MAG: succinate-semialdehyde dehydrogenase (NADP(+)) [Bacillus thermozeamaize]|jgi:succinate-semialdehyde dehydrogenase/glutarate-semialdehyde dehydrogenase|uniref:Aldehyde dehydrogenase n=1 Tax=Bacillus thermozeamaize TaxID=230954 RepID=A0A1Y3PND0_9BACI|nr:MAG: succinate-semialdehyde dehydrogenase (NADP(+)) [Bacillus thermozeamaize]